MTEEKVREEEQEWGNKRQKKMIVRKKQSKYSLYFAHGSHNPS